MLRVVLDPRSAVLAALALCACAPSLSDRRPPLYGTSSGTGLCSDTQIVDSTGIVAAESGCEERSSGMRLHRMSGARLQRVLRAFAALPPPGYYGSCAEVAYHLSISEPGKPTKSWTYCDASPTPERALFDAADSSIRDQ